MLGRSLEQCRYFGNLIRIGNFLQLGYSLGKLFVLWFKDAFARVWDTYILPFLSDKRKKEILGVCIVKKFHEVLSEETKRERDRVFTSEKKKKKLRIKKA